MKKQLHIWVRAISSSSLRPAVFLSLTRNNNFVKLLPIFLSLLLFSQQSKAQCGPNTPTFAVDLTCSPTCSWLSPNVSRADQCCGQSGVTCIKFIVTLGPGAGGISFGIYSGAVPSGALNYQVNCGPPAPVGSAICLTGPGPHVITFCKPGGNPNVYEIKSVPAAVAGTNIDVNQGCTDTIKASGFNTITAVWNSIYPGTLGAYNNLLSCSVNCLEPIVTGNANTPPYVDYQVCGIPVADCNFGSVCDTVRVNFHTTLLATIIPENPTICFGQTSTTLTASGSGGTPPYSYLWNNVNPSQNITVGTGTYTVKLSDASGCPPAYSTVTVTSFSVAITANAGADKTICKQSPTTTINGSVTGASGGIWSGGAGTFSPNNTTLSGLTYSPTAAELAAGFVDLTLTTTGNGTCPPATDIVRINYEGFTGTVAVTPIPISCFGGSDGTATVSVSGGSPPHTYSWNTVPAQTGATAINLGLGTHTVVTTNSIGCTTSSSVTITQPTPVALASSVTNVSCAGGSNGVISVSPTGGTAPYTYQWQPGNQTSSSINGLLAGTYTVTVRDSKLCTLVSNFTVTQPTPVTVSLTPTHVSCFNGSNGTANSTVAGGTPPYSYNWSSGATSPNATGLIAGTYTLTVTDNNGCTVSASTTITQPTQLLVNLTNTPETCNYLNNGTASAAASGGTAGYTYLWQPGAITTNSISNLSANTYTVMVTDAKGCTVIGNTVVSEPSPLTIAFIGQTNVSCKNGNDGTVTANPSGGNPGYSYLWMPGGTTNASKTGMAAGIYTVTVTDSKGCTETNSVTITEPPSLVVSATSTNETCSYLNNGTAVGSASGGTPGYTYLWQPGLQTTTSVSALAAGTYTLTVKDTKGCTEIANAVITQPAPITIAFTAVTNVSCFAGSDGTATASPAGGTPGYSYLWMPGATTNATKTGMVAGTYTVTVTDNNGCTETNTVTITQPTAVTAATNKTDETCNYLNNGTATAVPGGGTPGYTYLWQPGAATTATISNLAAGTYSLTITDSKGCPATATAVISQPAPITIAFVSQVNVSCFGGSDGSVAASPSGGSANYSYSWAPGGVTTNGISNIAAGTYTVTVTDSKGCMESNTVTITQPAPLTVSTTVTNETCSYLNNGTAVGSASGGTPGYTYLWQPGLQTTTSVSALAAGTYTLTVKDTKGCTETANAVITQPAPITIAFTAVANVSCFAGSDGTATASPAGGTPGYSYLWMPGATTNATKTGMVAGTYTVTVTDNNGCTESNTLTITQPTAVTASTNKTDETCNYLNNGTATAVPGGGTPGYTYLWQPGAATTATISNLAAGTYSLTITDSKGCPATATAVISQPAPITIAFVSQVNASCFGGSDGSVAASPSGGSANYSYSWAPGGATTNGISNIAAGTYTVTVTDSKGCMESNTVTITQPAPLTVSTTVTNETCSYLNDGTAVGSASGGTPGYTYLWQPGLQTTTSVSALAAGTYTLTVKDTKGCTETANAVITQPAPITIAFTAVANVSCFAGSDGTATASPAGGTPGYSYLWMPGATTNATKTGMVAGTYTVTVTDNNGCTESNTLTITQPTAVTAGTNKTDETCNYLNNGTATAVPGGGTPGYTYLWQPGAATTATISNLAAGTYSLTITDSKGCPATATAVISQPAPITIAFVSQVNVSCFGGSDGSVAASPSGGSANYSYSWAPGGATTNGISNIAAGTYTVTVTDSKGCMESNTVTITQPPLLSVSVSSVAAACYGASNGSATAVGAGGTLPYTYSWNPGNLTGSTITNLLAGGYDVTVTDTLGCTATNTVTVTEPLPMILSTTSTNSDCGQPNGSTTVSVAGGFAPYTYLWSPGGGTDGTATGLLSGAYTVVVTDATGCSASQWGNVNENSAPSVSIFSVTNVSCYGGSDGAATVISSGGIGPYVFSWLPTGGTDSIADGLAAGSYTVTVTGANGCQSLATTSPDITQPPALSINITNTAVSCFSGNDASAIATASGGVPNYAYEWLSMGVTDSLINNLSATTYTVQVTDANNCIKTEQVTIPQPNVLTVSLSTTPTSCFNGADGTAGAIASGGTAPYNYSWMPGNISGPDIAQLTAGTYTVSINDANGCSIVDSITVIQPAAVTTAVSSINSNCSLANGQASVVAAGGTPGYTYLWAPSGSTNANATALLAGSYTVAVTDNNGCTANDTVVVNDNASPVANVAGITNVTCFGAADGTATVNVTGNAGPYTYLWTPSGATTATATGLAPGTYTVVVTDTNACQSTPVVSPEITQPDPIFIATSQTNVSCFAGNNASASATASGGTAPYDYLWSPGGNTTTSITNLATGSYTIQVTDANNCIENQTVVITQPTAALSVSLTSTLTNCFNSADGTSGAIAAGGTAPYNYSWMPGNISGPDIAQLTAGTYTVSINDANGCSIVDSITVIQPAAVTTAVSSINSNCSLANGQASVVAAGGTPGYTYLWAPSGSTNANATALLAGSYTVAVTDNNGCTANDTVVVNDNASPVANVAGITNVTCFGAADGTATVNVTGNAGPYTYLWTPSGATTATATGLAPGTYTVVVNDTNACQSTPVVSPEITQPDPIFIATSQTNVSCFAGNNASASATVSGGTAPYDYLWSPGGNTTTSITNLAAGSYTVQVTDANNCIENQTIIITQPTAALSVSLTSTLTDCFNSADGTSGAIAAGGTAPYNYSWMPGNISGPDIAQLTAGTYTVSINDANGCSIVDSITVIQPAAVTTAVSSINSNCSLANGQASVVAAGGTPGYTYLWAPSGSTNTNATALLAGSYTVAVTDNNGCTANDTVVVNDNASPVANVAGITNVTCFGAADGTATVNVTGNAGPYTYLWTPSGATTATATGLAPGTYTVVVTDTNACQSTPVVSPEITQPDPIFIATSQTNVSCFVGNNASASATASGGTAPYDYLWSPGGNTTSSITNLAAGTYTVQVTDANTCIENQTVVITQPTILTSSITASADVNCFGDASGSATVGANGGTSPYSYAWTSGGNGPTEVGLAAGTYTVTINDINGCSTSSNVTISQPAQALSAGNTATNATCNGANNGSISVLPAGGTPGYSYQWSPSVSTSNTATGLAPGNYNITVTDINGCLTTTSNTITEPSVLSGSLTIVNPTCSTLNGSITSQVSGGTSQYTYSWQGSTATASSITNLGAGNYNLTITDAANCTLVLSTNLIVVYDTLATNLSITNVSCYGGNNGEATISVTQGTAPYTINWLPYGGSNATATSLDTGMYVINITDAMGCQTSDTAIISEPSPLNVSISAINNVLCNGGNTGSITPAVTGGTGPPYSYLWTPSGITTATANNLSAGTYTLTVTDQNNCSAALSATVTEPAVLSSVIDSVMNPLCNNTFGSATVVASGGTIPYSYSWSAPTALETGSTAYNLGEGSYTVTVTDTNGCSTSSIVLITAPPAVITTAGPNDTICLGQSGTISAAATGGTGSYTYAWQPSGAITNGTLNVTPTTATTYTVVAYDQNGCPGTQDIVRVIPYSLTGANIEASGNTPICPGQSTYIYAEASGDTGPLSYMWNNGLGSGPGAFQVIPSQPTMYIVDVTNSCGTTVSDTIDILFNPPPIIDFTSTPNSACTYAILQFNDNSTTGNPNDSISSWLWNFGDGTTSTNENPTHSYTSAGNYSITLTVTTDGGCTNTNSTVPFIVTAYPSPTAVFSMNTTYLHLPQDILQLNNQSTGANSYSWDFGDGGISTLFNPVYAYNSIGIFQIQLIAMNQYGCTDTTTAEVTTDTDIIFPNAFTPNPDGSTSGTYDINSWSNDIFFPYTSGVIEYELQIFNRWGELIFESFDVKKGWDGYYRGQLCQQDVYVWKAYVKLNNGKVFNKAGDLTLIE